jgi:hypothetical protein
MVELDKVSVLPEFEKAFKGATFRKDARAFLSLDDTTFDTVVQSLSSETGILARFGLEKLLTDAGIPRDPNVTSLRRFIDAFGRWGRKLPPSGIPLLINTLKTALKGEFNEPELETMSARVERLMGTSFPGLELADKVDAVVSSTGKAFRSANFISDIRPVFDSDRSKVLAVVPMTTLRLVTESDDDGDVPTVLEARLTENDVNELCKKLVEAQRKLAVLKRLLAEKGIEVAECSMVVNEEAETK